MTSLHDDMGHLGIECILDFVSFWFYWLRMATEIERKIQTCPHCVFYNAQPEQAAP